ncbi:hypothetical protein C475_13527 [Halosimplex carlsbadense 2-9-1]|uniref:DUF7344 domain-containing protein n=1 Tax=Halosimplex carlsbadense 2-9-1 TaxID=797114 RepID=M0CNQ4_9EURY|nr:hypothetical protein [Halosimplex carlsbadense]ELZ24273.1 hypothetical protein C475_13527 [Halosimplex carlsbadense 2-9-1]
MPRSDDTEGGTNERRPPTEGSESADGSDARLPASVVADLRASDRRRRVLARLDDCDGPIPVSDLARLVVAADRGKSPGDVPVDVVERVREDLFQRHLPKLIATGVVSYNSLVGTVELASDDPRLLGDDGGDRVDDPPTLE